MATTGVPYAARVFVDYLSSTVIQPLDLPIRVLLNEPVSRPRRLVTVRTAPAGQTAKPRFFSWRRLIIQTWFDDDEEANANLAEEVRHLIVYSVWAGIGIRKIVIVGEPSRFDSPNDSSPRFQMTADALFRPEYKI